MPPVTTQQPPVYQIREIIDVPKGATPVYPDKAASLVYASKSLSNADYDRYTRLYNNSAGIDALLVGAPAALPPVVTPDPDNPGAYLVRLPYSGGRATFVSGAFIKSQTGTLVTHLGGEHFRIKVDPAYAATVDQGTMGQASFEAEAVMDLATHRKISWAPVLISFTGTKLPAATPGPSVISQPSPRSFAQGVATAFSVDMAPLFSVPAGASSYQVQNDDGTALTFFTLNSITGAVASLTSPASGFAAKQVKLKVTDVNGRSAELITTWDVVENPPIRILSTPPTQTVANASTGNIALAQATLFDNSGEAYSVALKLADGTNPPAGYSYNGVNIAYPVEGAPVTRSFIIRATETGPLARSYDTPAFTFDRPAALPIIVDALTELTVPENAVTRLVIDARLILGTNAAETIQLADGSSLPSPRYALQLNTPSAGKVTVDIQAANNEIFTQAVRLYGTTAGVDTIDNFNFRSIHNPPVDGLPSTITLLTDASHIIDPVAASDDPAVNLLVAGSVTLDVGSASIVSGKITATPQGASDATGSLSYILEAAAGGARTAVVKTINWRQPVAPFASALALQTQSTDGVTPPTINLSAYWTTGDYAIDPASYRFFDANDQPIGNPQTVTGSGTMTISSAGIASFAPVAGFVGALTFRVAPRDIRGNQGEIRSWTHTQLANPGNPPPGTIEPNTLDGKPILQIGIEADDAVSAGSHILWKDRSNVVGFEAVAAGSNKLWSTNLKGSMQKVIDGESDPTTGWFYLAPGETMPIWPPRTTQRTLPALANFQAGDWEFNIEVRTGDTGDASGFSSSWTESGTVTGIAGGQSRLVNGGAAFTFTRRRFQRTLTSADTSQATLPFTNSSGAGIWVRRGYAGRVADKATYLTDPFTAEGKSRLRPYKVIRIMDHCSPAGKAAYASNMVGKNDYLLTANARSWVASGNPQTANSDLLRQGTNIYKWAKLCAEEGQALHFNVPITFGMGVTAGMTDGFYTSSASANPFADPVNSAAELAAAIAYGARISQNFSSIIQAAKAETRLWAQARIQDLIDAGYPDKRIHYVEFGNENWGYNNFPIPNAYIKAVTDHLKNRTDGKPVYSKNTSYGGGGYIAHLYANEYARALAEMKPNQQVKFVIGAQTNAGFNNALQWADGWNVFAKEFPLDSQPIGRLGLMATTYLSEGFKWTNRSSGTNNNGRGNPFGATSRSAFYAAYNAARAVSLDNLLTIILNWYLDPLSEASSLYGQLGQVATIAAACASAGMEFHGCYEGLSLHEDVSGTDTTNMPTVIADRNAFRDSAYGEQLFARLISEFAARYPNAINANYYEYVRDDNLATAGAPWFERPVTSVGTVPTAGAAKAIYDAGRQGAGSVTPPTNLNEDFEGETVQTLTLAGMTLAASFTVLDDAGDRALYSANEFDIASTTLGTTLQANAIRAVRLIIKPDGTRTAEYSRLKMTSTGDFVAIKPGASGAMVLTFLGTAGPDAVTTSGLNLLDGSAHDLTITYYAHATAGLIEVKRTSDNFVYGTFTGNTIANMTAGASAHIDAIDLRGKVFWRHVENLTGVAPPPTTTEWETTATLAYSAGIEAGFIWDINLADLPGGAAHQFFQKAQANGGDIRAYLSDKITRLPLHVLSFNKTAGTGRLRVRTPNAMAVGAVIKLKTGGDGTLTQPASDAAFGSRAVYADFDLYTTDMIRNHATDEAFGQSGGAVISGPNGLVARGYDSLGVNAGDATTSTLTTNNAALSCGLFFKRVAKGGGGVGVADTGFARLFHMQNGDDLYVQNDLGLISLEREFATTDSKWTTPYATLNAWAGFCYSADGTTATPIFTLNAANAPVTVATAPSGAFLPGNTTLFMGNHNGLNRNLDGGMCEYWRRSATTTQAFHVAWQTMIGGLSTFATYNSGAAW